MPEAPKRITGQRPPVGEEANWNWAYRNKTPIEFQGHTYLITGMTRSIPSTYVLELQKPAPAKESPRCATCKHFQPEALDATEMYCHAPAIVDESGVLFKPPSPDFGCVLHEPKEGE